MGWFEEQIKERIKRDDKMVRDANMHLSSVVVGDDILSVSFSQEETEEKAAGEIAKYYHVRSFRELRQRKVYLEKGWYKDALGAMLGKNEKGDTIALIPNGSRCYTYYDYELNKKIKVDKKTIISNEAICFYCPLPDKSLTINDLILFIFKKLSRADLISYLLFAILVAAIGLIIPYTYNLLFSKVIPNDNTNILLNISVILLSVTLAMSLVQLCQNIASSKIQIKIQTALSPAVYMRILSLPVSFFKDYPAGELSERSAAINNLINLIFSTIIATLISFIFSLIYLVQVGDIAPMLLKPAIIIFVVFVIVSLTNTLVSMHISKKKMTASAKLNGLLFSLVLGIQKIKLTGSEKRAYVRWADSYKEKAQYEYAPPMLMRISGPLNSSLTMIGTVLFYYIGASNGLSVAQYMAFTVAFGMISGTVFSLCNVVSAISQIKPTLEIAKPILDTRPESYDESQKVTYLSGDIDISNVSFKYDESSPVIFDNLSMKINSGEYVAVVGKTGCGKSTLVRLLLGFEKPQKGAIYYNGINVETIDKRSMRRQVGIVLQNSTLFAGSIFSNITISAPGMTMDEAWEIAQKAGIYDDIKSLPMGMFTQITEDGGGFSGGQRQRLLIARALATKPSIIIFDEATSALDNITQKRVTESLDNLKCTKIIIAHRLSTIKNCDRIFVLNEGSIVEEGNFDSLITKNGYFADLVKRQMV